MVASDEKIIGKGESKQKAFPHQYIVKGLFVQSGSNFQISNGSTGSVPAFQGVIFLSPHRALSQLRKAEERSQIKYLYDERSYQFRQRMFRSASNSRRRFSGSLPICDSIIDMIKTLLIRI